MDIELLKELLDAGFKSNHQMDMDTGSWCVNCPWDEQSPDKGFKDMCFPTLSELIKACGVDFRAVEILPLENRKHGICKATGWDGKGGYGKTFEEAVTRLWLALNKK